MIKVYVMSAFCEGDAGGNLAGLVFCEKVLSAETMMEISKRLGYSETAFILPSEKADFKLLYFTPTDEVPLCGHATIASFSGMFYLGKIGAGSYTIETGAGILSVSVDQDGLIMMEQNLPDYLDQIMDEEISPIMGEGTKDGKFPVQIMTTGLRDILYPVKDEETLMTLRPDFSGMTRLSKEKDVVGVHAFTLNHGYEGVDCVCRNFAPLYGIDEESATGTSNCALAGYLYYYCEKKNHYVFLQGLNMGLPSRIFVSLEDKDGKITKIQVGGYGRFVCEKDMEL